MSKALARLVAATLIALAGCLSDPPAKPNPPVRPVRDEFWPLEREAPSAERAGVFHSGQVNTLAFSPDARILASGGHDGSVKLWLTEELAARPESAMPVALGAQFGPITSLAFSPDGKLLVVGSDKGVFLWNVANREKPELVSELCANLGVEAVAFSPDGKTILWGMSTWHSGPPCSYPELTFVWDLQANALIKCLELEDIIITVPGKASIPRTTFTWQLGEEYPISREWEAFWSKWQPAPRTSTLWDLEHAMEVGPPSGSGKPADVAWGFSSPTASLGLELPLPEEPRRIRFSRPLNGGRSWCLALSFTEPWSRRAATPDGSPIRYIAVGTQDGLVAVLTWDAKTHLVASWRSIIEDGKRLYEDHDFERAAVCATRAIEIFSRSRPPDGSAHLLRAQSRVAAAQNGALPDLDEAIRLHEGERTRVREGETSPWAVRAAAHAVGGDAKAALTDWNDAVRCEDGRSWVLLRGRALARAVVGDGEGALEDLREAHALAPTDERVALWIALLTGETEQFAGLDSGSGWPAKLLLCVEGKLTGDQLTDEARRGKASDHERLEHLCEAYACMGVMAELRGDRAAARSSYELGVVQGVGLCPEYAWARERLARLAAGGELASFRPRGSGRRR